jgi:hypothetical protein
MNQNSLLNWPNYNCDPIAWIIMLIDIDFSYLGTYFQNSNNTGLIYVYLESEPEPG